MKKLISTEERFLSKYIVDEKGCWIWQGSLTRPAGYGNFRLPKQKMIRAHRFSYELFKGPIPEQLAIDHLCRVRSCVNPEHLEAVSTGENNRRAAIFRKKKSEIKMSDVIKDKAQEKEWFPKPQILGKKQFNKASLYKNSHCIHGHPFDDKNTYIDKNGHWHCLACTSIRKERYKKQKQVVP